MMHDEFLLIPNEEGEFEPYEPYTALYIDTEEDYNFIKSAVEKQMPKKPQIEKYFYGELYHCPACETIISGALLCKFCPECGQKIDWTEVKK